MDSLQRAPIASLLLLGALAAPAAAQERAWLDVNVGVAIAGEDPLVDTDSFEFRDETATLGVEYSVPAGATFDVGAGWMFHPRFGAGASLAWSAHEDVATVSASIPHPFFFDLPGTDSDTTNTELRLRERAVHLQVMAILTPPGSRVDVRVFGGPTYFSVQQDTIEDISVLETLNGEDYSIEIVDATIVEDAEGDAWGFHVGGDVRFFFSEHVGIGGVIRFSSGEVELPGLFGDPRDADVGGVQIGGGLRVRF